MKIIVAPDSLKGSVSSPEAAQAMARGIARAAPNAEVVLLPLADGGEGTLDALLLAADGPRITLSVRGPLGDPVQAAYGLLTPKDGTAINNSTAIVEMAQAAGLNLVPHGKRDLGRASTYGVGELVLAAARSGAARVVVGLGGSGTNDGGAGAMQALGVRFYDARGVLLPPGVGAGHLKRIARIDMEELAFPVGAVSLVIASDVTNPLLGAEGASQVYGPQKGASPAAVAEMDGALAHYAALPKRDLGLGQDVAGRPGVGAGGGLGVSLMAFFGADRQSGIDLVLDAVGFDQKARGADWVFTAEGRIDAQTLQGKAIAGILARCRALGPLPVVALAGSVDSEAADTLARQGLVAAFSITPGPMPLETAMAQGALLLEQTAERVARLLLAARR